MAAKTDKRPEPEAFSFRPQQHGEVEAEYKRLKGKAKGRHDKEGDYGRSKALKGLLKEKAVY